MTAAESFNLWSLTLKTKARCLWVFSQCERSFSQCLFPLQSQVNFHYQHLFLFLSLCLLALPFSLSFGFSLPPSDLNLFTPALCLRLLEGCWVSAIVAFHQTWSFLEFSIPCFASRRPSVSWLPLRSPDVVTCRPSCFSFPQPRCKYIETGVQPFFARLSIAAKLLKPSSAVTCAWLLPCLHPSLWMFEFYCSPVGNDEIIRRPVRTTASPWRHMMHKNKDCCRSHALYSTV